MSLTLNALRDAIAAQILTISGMQQSPHLPDYFGRTQSTIAHKSFTILIGNVNAFNERQRSAVGVYCVTNVEIMFAYRMRPHDVYPTDYNLALNLENQIINKSLESYAAINGKVQIRFEGSSRTSTQSNEYTLHTLTFRVNHTL